MIIRDLTAPEIQRYVGLNENQLKRYYEPDPGLFICESEKVIRRAMATGYRAESFFAEEEKTEIALLLAEDRNIPVFTASHEVM